VPRWISVAYVLLSLSLSSLSSLSPLSLLSLSSLSLLSLLSPLSLTLKLLPRELPGFQSHMFSCSSSLALSLKLLPRELPKDEPVCFRIITWATEYFDQRASAGAAEVHADQSAAPQLVEVAHCMLDHIRSLRVYCAALDEICASNAVACHVLLFTPHPTLVFAGEPARVSAALRDMKTRNVDVNSRGQPCKERLLRVHYRVSMPLSDLYARGSNATLGDMEMALAPTCTLHNESLATHAELLLESAGVDIEAGVSPGRRA
jgi:hypothetical protein